MRRERAIRAAPLALLLGVAIAVLGPGADAARWNPIRLLRKAHPPRPGIEPREARSPSIDLFRTRPNTAVERPASAPSGEHAARRAEAERWVETHLPPRHLGDYRSSELVVVSAETGFKVAVEHPPDAFGREQLLLYVKRGPIRFSLRRHAVDLREIGLVVPALEPSALGTITIDGVTHEAMIVPRFAVGSKDQALTTRLAEIGRADPGARKRAAAGLERIRDGLHDAGITLSDAQFLIARDGSVVVFDPLEVLHAGEALYERERTVTDAKIALLRDALSRWLRR
jgi:hypothetical protein